MSEYVGRSDVEFYATEGPKRFLLSCSPCDGTGKSVRFMADDLSPIAYWEHSCSVCGGRGVVRFESPDVPIVHSACRGTGRQWHRSTGSELRDGYALEQPYYCLGCKGYGIISLMGDIAKLSGDPRHEEVLKFFVEQHRSGNLPTAEQIRWLEESSGRPIPKREQPVSNTDRQLTGEEKAATSRGEPKVEVDYRQASPITILAMIDEQTFVTPCRHCEATGKRPFVVDRVLAVADWWSTEVCPVCKGATVLRLKSPDVPVPHGMCRGTGRQKTVPTVTPVQALPLTEDGCVPEFVDDSETSGYFIADKCGHCSGLGIRTLSDDEDAYSSVRLATV